MDVPDFGLRLDGRPVLLTGASGGLGAPTAETLSAAGAKVFILDRDAARGTALAKRIDRRFPGKAEFFHHDLSSALDTSRVISELASAHPIDILVNNAAIYPAKDFKDYTIGEYEQVQTVNVTSAFACCQAIAPGMIARRWGRIINVASITLSGGWSHIAPYVISKGSLIGLTRALARELGEFGITSNAISPGAFPTDAEKIQGNAEEYSRTVLDRQAIKRRGTPADFAYSLLFLASEHSGFITGQSLNVDGGWIMQ
jgi:3-oxoacyl-[acyl-carrier protein] reductase